jgi:hypothetical protein
MRELDVHGLSVDDALKTFVDFYNRSIKRDPNEPIRVIHGYGSSGEGGKIRLKLRKFLVASASSLDWKPGEDAERNEGVTIVYPRKVLIEREELLGAAILEYCSTPRSESKIAGEFRTHDSREIKQAIRALLRQGRITENAKGGHTVYVARFSGHNSGTYT